MKRKEYAIYTGFKVVWDQFTKYYGTNLLSTNTTPEHLHAVEVDF